jgi:hypothetical protein
MKRLLLLLIPTISIAATEVTVIPGTWDLYSGVSRINSFTSQAECVERAAAEAQKKGVDGRYGCRTIVGVNVVVRPDVPVPPDPIPEPPQTGKPTKENTGPRTANLKPLASTKITQPGVYENFTSGSVTVAASNVTLRNCIIKTSSSYGVKIDGNQSGILIEHCDISGMDSAAVYGGGFTARWNYIHNSGADGFKPTKNAVIESNYLTELGYKPEAHADGIQMESGSNVVIRGNNFAMAKQPGFKNSHAIIVQSANGPVSNITVENNWINGGGFSIQFRDKKRGHGAPSGISIRNNQFGPDYQFGPWNIDGNTKPCSNVWQGTGALMPQNSKC